MKNKHKWVIYVLNKDKEKLFASSKDENNYTKSLKDALLFDSREAARNGRVYSSYGEERVEKVLLEL